MPTFKALCYRLMRYIYMVGTDALGFYLYLFSFAWNLKTLGKTLGLEIRVLSFAWPPKALRWGMRAVPSCVRKVRYGWARFRMRHVHIHLVPSMMLGVQCLGSILVAVMWCKHVTLIWADIIGFALLLLNVLALTPLGKATLTHRCVDYITMLGVLLFLALFIACFLWIFSFLNHDVAFILCFSTHPFSISFSVTLIIVSWIYIVQAYLGPVPLYHVEDRVLSSHQRVRLLRYIHR